MNSILRRSFLLVISLILPCIIVKAQNIPNSPPTEGLVAWYPFNGNAEDASLNSNDGSIYGSQFSTDKLNNTNSAIIQNSDPNYIRTQSAINDVANDFTISFWVYPLKNDIIKSQGVIGTEGTGNMAVIHPSHGSTWGSASDNAGVGVNVGINQIQIVEHTHLYIASPLVYPSNLIGWNHITVVYKDHVPSLYLNGTLVAKGLASAIQNVRPSNGFCGWYTESGFGRSFFPNGTVVSNQFNGSYDEIMIYNRPLSDNEVLLLYNSANSAPTDVLLSNNTILENLPGDKDLGLLSTIDIEGGAMKYELVTGVEDNSKFYIDGDKLKSATSFDYETQSTYTIKIRVTDTGGLSFEKSFNISIQNVLVETIPLNGLVAWYPFNGNANDESGNGNNGAINGAVTLTSDRKGNTEKAYSFNGNTNSFINVPMSTSLKIKNQITITAWIYMEDGYYNPRVLSNELAGYDHYYMSVAGTSNVSRNLEAGLNGVAGSSGFCCGGVKGIDVPAKSWHFIAFTVNGDGLSKLYLDGELIKSLQGSVVNSTSYGPNLNIGRNSYPAYDAWGGKLDDIGIWNRALSASEVIQLYTASKQVQVITFNSLNPKTYGDVSFALTATSNSGLAVAYTSSDHNVATVSGNIVTIKGAGTTVITATESGNDTFGPAQPIEQTLIINKAVIIATATNQSRVYGNVNPSLSITYSGFKNSETSSVIDTAPTATTPATITNNVGTYNIIPAGGIDNNYSFNHVNGTLTITKATLTATADNKSRVYGDANPSFTIIYSGFKNSETASVVDASPSSSTSATLTSNAGTYSIVPSGGADNNYSFTYVNGALTITKAVLTATADNKSRVYGDLNPSFTNTYSGFKNSETASVIDTSPTSTTSATPASNAGTYSIVPSGGADNNYSFTYVNGALTITKAALTATADNKSRFYGDTNPSFTITYSGFKNSETASVIDTAPTATTNATLTSNVGTYSIVPAGGTDNNYSFAFANGNLTITKATLTATADNKSKVYGDAIPTLTLSYTGFKNSETSSVIDSGPTVTTSATINSNAGTYSIIPAGGADNNYSFAFGNGILTITKATVTVSADNKSRIYGDANPVLSIAYSGFKNSETASVIDTAPTATTPALQTSNVGSYNIVPSGGLDNNYAFVYVNGSITITKAMLTITAENKSRAYGDSNPVFTITYAGFKNSESSSVIDTSPTATTDATQTSDAGTYSIVPAGGVDNNYLFAYLDGTLAINKATLNVKADDKTRGFGESNPTFSITYSGFKNSETETILDTPPLASTTATETSIVGLYDIVISGGVDGNYNFTYINGVLKVVGSEQTITFSTPNNVLETIGSFTLNATSSSGLPVTFSTTNPSKISITGNIATVISPGSVTIIATQEGNTQYQAAAPVTNTLCIIPKKPSITATGLDSENAILSSSSTSNNLWYRNGTALPGATNSSYTIDGKGLYTVKVTVEGCSSELSDPFAIIITDVIDSEHSIKVSLHPNPASHELKITLSGVKQDETSAIVVYDLSGRVISKEIMTGNESLLLIDKYPPGNYLMKVTNRSFLFNTRFVKH